MKFSKGASQKRILAIALILVGLLTVIVLLFKGVIPLKYKAETTGCTWQKPGIKVIPAGDNMPYIVAGETLHLNISIKSGGIGSGCPTHNFVITWSSDLPVGWTSKITPTPIQVPPYIPFTGSVYPGDYYGTKLVDFDINTSPFSATGKYPLPYLVLTDIDQTNKDLASQISAVLYPDGTPHTALTLYLSDQISDQTKVYRMNLTTDKTSYTPGISKSSSRVIAKATLTDNNQPFTLLATYPNGSPADFISWWMIKPDYTWVTFNPSKFKTPAYEVVFNIGRSDQKGTYQIVAYACCNRYSNIVSQPWTVAKTSFTVK